MQLLCNGVVLDLPENAGLQFTHDNQLFAFDKMSCERTTEFALPCTPTNDSVLALARVPAYKGTGMRVKYDAQLQCGTAVRDGYLYVSSFDGKNYKAVFVCGELVGLQAIRDAGSARNLLQYDSSYQWNDNNLVDADSESLPNVGAVKYQMSYAGGHCSPSVSLRWLIEQMAQKIGVVVNFNNAQADDRQRLVNLSGVFKLDDTETELINNGSGEHEGQEYAVSLQNFLGISYLSVYNAYAWSVVAVRDGGGLDWDVTSEADRTVINEWVIPFDCVLEFPKDFPDTLCLVTGNILANSHGNFYPFVNFLGSRHFDMVNGQLEYTGLPLKGQRVSIPANTPFILTDGTGLDWPVPQYEGQTSVVSFNAFDIPAYAEKIKISIDKKFEYSENVPYNAILPDLNMVDLLRIYAAITGTLMYYENGQIYFDSLVFSDWDNVSATDKIMQRKDVMRTFGDYAQKNIVRFASADDVSVVAKLQATYTIENDNLEEEKELQMLKCSEGNFVWEWVALNSSERLYALDPEGSTDTQTIAIAATTDSYMLRASLPKIEGLQQLCDASTQVKMQVRMTMAQDNAITPKTKILCEGTEYVWTARSWQKDTAEFTLAKI